jgi:multidrug efflux system membrane fusion protein
VSSGYVTAQAIDRLRVTRVQSAAQDLAAAADLEKIRRTLVLHQATARSVREQRLLADWRLSRTRVFAPVDGYVNHLTLRPGDLASSARPAIGIVDAHAWRVEANLKEYYLRHLHPESPVWVWLDTQPWRLYRARVQGVAHGISREPGESLLAPYVSPTVNWIRLQRRIPVRLDLIDPPPPADLYMGADARVLALY